ncbi:hypothetical protein SOVF_060690, partial [Spinacia oleracea]
MIFSEENLLRSCHMNAISNGTLVSTLKPKAGCRNISLFYGCTNCHSRYHHNTFSCSNSDGSNGTAYYFGNSPDIRRRGTSCSCKNNVTFLMDKRGIDELSSTNASLATTTLNKWPIKMEYMASFVACSKCEKSEGRCGSSQDSFSDQFACYCQDGPQPLECPQSGITNGLLLGLLIEMRTTRLILEIGTIRLLLGLGIGTMILVVLVIRGCKRRATNKFSILWRRQTKRDQNLVAFLQSYRSLAPKRYTYAEIRKITSSFKDKLGEGGYGSVYKGRLCNGRFVAVKKLKVLKGDGKDFINE